MRLLFIGLSLPIIALTSLSCRPPIRTASGVSQADATADIVSEKYGMRVNLTTNTATFYEEGNPIRTWPVATARNDGKVQTPEGKFRFHNMTICTIWQSPRTGAQIAPCASSNPVGERAMWFHGTSYGEYGAHGVDESLLGSVTAPTAEGRRQSSGCIRHKPSDIDWLTNKVASLYGTTPDAIAQLVAAKRYTTLKPVDKGLALEVGHWPSDPRPSMNTQPDASSQDTVEGCTTANASAIISAAGAVPVWDSHGTKIGSAKSGEPVCPTASKLNGRIRLFFPVAPSGYGWVEESYVTRRN